MGDVWVYNYRASDAPSADHEDDTFELIPGAKLFCEASYTMLNVTPLEDHQALALLGFKPSAEPPFDIEELTLRLLHSRGVALIRNANRDELALASLVQQGIDPQPEQYSFIDGIVFDDTRLPLHPGGFAYRFMGMVGKEWIPITRVFSRGAEGWNVTDYSEWPLPGEENRAKKLSSKQLPLEAVQVYCRGLDVLYQSQRSYRALDRMFSLTLRQLGGVNAKTIISGYLGNNQQASDELHREDRDVALFPGNATVNRVGTTAAIDQLRSSFEALLPLYLRSVHIAWLADKTHITADRSRLTLLPMITFEHKVRRAIREVLAMFGITAQFEEIQLEDAEERAKRYELLKLMVADRSIDEVKFKEKAAQLAA